MGKPENLPDKPSGRRFQLAENQELSPVGKIAPDPGLDPARIGIYANNLPSAARDHAPAWEDYPRGWTTQQPWYHPEFPLPASVRCILCAQTHRAGKCGVEKALVSLGVSVSP